MTGLRRAFATYLVLAGAAYVAAQLVGMAAPGIPTSPLEAILTHADPDLFYRDHPGWYFALLGALGLPTYLAMASVPFLLYVAASRAAAPHPALARALAASVSPLRAWSDACGAAAGAVSAPATARDAALALALGAHVAYSALHLVDTAAIALGGPAPLEALRDALHAAAGIPVPDGGAYVLAARAMDALAHLALLASVPLLGSIVERHVAPELSRLWRGR